VSFCAKLCCRGWVHSSEIQGTPVGTAWRDLCILAGVSWRNLVLLSCLSGCLLNGQPEDPGFDDTEGVSMGTPTSGPRFDDNPASAGAFGAPEAASEPDASGGAELGTDLDRDASDAVSSDVSDAGLPDSGADY
jgi:hypothetical protein